MRVIVSLYAVADPNEESLGIPRLIKKLKYGSVLPPEDQVFIAQIWDNCLVARERVRLVRNKHFAHRDRKYSYPKAMQESGLTFDDLGSLLIGYEKIVEKASSLHLLYLPTELIRDDVKHSIGLVKNALLKDYESAFQKNSELKARRGF